MLAGPAGVRAGEASTEHFLAGLNGRGLELWVEAGKLRYRGSRALLSDELLSELKRRRDEIIAALEHGAPVPDVPAGIAQPLSYGQQSLLFVHRSAPGTSAYNVALPARVRSRVDVAELKRACQGLVDRHAALRTTYSVGADGPPIQIVHPRADVSFTEIDASGWAPGELHEEVDAAHRQAFDLERGPVFRAYLFTSSPDDHVLLLSLHHIAYDARSLELMVSDLKALYGGATNGEGESLPPLDRQYVDFVRYQERMLHGERGAALRTYWHDRLDGILPELELPTDRPYPPVMTYAGAEHHFKMNRALAERFTAFARTEACTLYTACLAVFQTLLYRYTGQDDQVLGSLTGGRTRAEFNQMVGFFVNPVVIRNSINGAMTFRQVLKRTRTIVLEALEHQDYPFPLLVKELHPHRDPSKTPIFQVLFNFLAPRGDEADLLFPGEPPARLRWGSLELEHYPLDQQEGQFDLSLEVVDTPNDLLGVLKYRFDLFEADTIERLGGHFETLLAGIVEQPDAPIAELPLLSDAERALMLVDWNPPESGHDDFEERPD